MAKKPLTKEQLKESIEKSKTEIRQGENLVNQLKKENVVLESKQRTRRLIQRGAILESMIREADNLTNEQIKKMLHKAFSLSQAILREMADGFRAENAVAVEAQIGENISPGTSWFCSLVSKGALIHRPLVGVVRSADGVLPLSVQNERVAQK